MTGIFLSKNELFLRDLNRFSGGTRDRALTNFIKQGGQLLSVAEICPQSRQFADGAIDQRSGTRLLCVLPFAPRRFPCLYRAREMPIVQIGQAQVCQDSRLPAGLGIRVEKVDQSAEVARILPMPQSGDRVEKRSVLRTRRRFCRNERFR
ncbi:hypothetical protein ASD52_36410 [Ensifer sp. Root142]|nr:hypothetical protein ASD52_36410 [Ensifer sp. Root142]